ncbi:unnamed protein product, partial [Ascophyllum nodosum]
EIYSEIINSGTYFHSYEELAHGARVAWRNSAKCIGRITWNALNVRDKRHVADVDEIFAECMEHQRQASVDGSVKACMTIFAPQAPGERMGLRMWNAQMVSLIAFL